MDRRRSLLIYRGAPAISDGIYDVIIIHDAQISITPLLRIPLLFYSITVVCREENSIFFFAFLC
jgi:hypothetical protein